VTWPPDHDLNARAAFLQMVPEPLHDGIEQYIERGRPSGDFLTAIYGGDLFAAATRADQVNRHYLRDIALFLFWHAPSAAIGSPEKVEAWVERGGLARHQQPVHEG
jgi:hypothetical protein